MYQLKTPVPSDNRETVDAVTKESNNEMSDTMIVESFLEKLNN